MAWRGVRTIIAVSLANTPTAVLQAQDAPYPKPPDTLVISPGGVDLRSGTYIYRNTDLTIGDPADGGIALTRQSRDIAGRASANNAPDGFGQFLANWTIRFSERTRGAAVNGYDVSLTRNGTSETFFSYDHTSFQLQSLSGAGSATLNRYPAGGGNYYYVYRSSGGETITSLPSSTGLTSAAEVKTSDGITYTLTYSANGRKVVSNRGYALVVEMISGLARRACVLNAAITVLPTGFICPAGVPTVSYSYAGEMMTSATDVTGVITAYTNNFTFKTAPYQESFYKAGSTQPYLTNTYNQSSGTPLVTISDQLFADGRTFHYSWEEVGNGEPPTGTVWLNAGYVENGNRQTALTWAIYQARSEFAPVTSPGPTSVTDPLGRVTNFNYGPGFDRLVSHQLPNGRTQRYAYDNYKNIVELREETASGFAPDTLVTRATFDCSQLVSCNKPTFMTDPHGNVTDYTYASEHGGLLTETGPAVGGIRPQTRNEYVQRYAWILAPGGGYQPAGPPVWLLSGTRSCRTTAASEAGCAGGAGDETVTTYDYGPDSGPNNLWVRGVTVQADGGTLRTCYGYDDHGRRISETQPNAGLGACP